MLGLTRQLSEREQELQELIEACLGEAKGFLDGPVKPAKIESGQAILALDPADQVLTMHLLMDGFLAEMRSQGKSRNLSFNTAAMIADNRIIIYQELMKLLCRRDLPYSDDDLADLLRQANDEWIMLAMDRPHEWLLGAIQRHYLSRAVPPALAKELRRVEQFIAAQAYIFSEDKSLQKLVKIAVGDLDPKAVNLDFEWSRLLARQLAGGSEQEVAAWSGLVEHALSATASKPSKKWLEEAADKIDTVSQDRFVGLFGATVENILAEQFDQQPLQNETNSTLLKGFLWCASLLPPESVARDIKQLAIYCFRKIPNVGAVCPRVGNACVHVLGQFPGVDAVAMLNELNQKVKYASARKLIEAALNAAAERNNMSRFDLEDISVPDFGLDSNGELRRKIGDCSAIVRVRGQNAVDLSWQKDGTEKTQKSVPASIKTEFAAEILEFKKLVKDLQTTLQSQVARLESMYLQDRCWSFADWQARFMRHPLMGIVTHKLVWEFESDGRTTTAICAGDGLVDAIGESVQFDEASASVRLWHPISASTEQVFAWRRFLIDREITQPFKQAHREVYLLTGAERETEFYSNRFAAHVLKQHQLNALCQQRGWQYALQGSFDSWNAPTLKVPAWNLTAELYLDTIDAETSEMGIFLYVGSDQVRFSRDHEALRLSEIDAIVFSEVMRNVDLFISVCSVGNDPEWCDRGVDEHLDYWHDYSFGDLSATAQTRGEILESLLPKLKIADRCSLQDRFLVVEGKLRTYKIHLGSANILMEPDDLYLCIVEGRSKKSNWNLLLPFEGDHRIAVILSKAFLLADDDKITDRNILSQIQERI